MKLILFDIDGTLLNSHGLGKTGFELSLKAFFGKPFDLSYVDWFGRTDEEVLIEVLKNNGYHEADIAPKIPGIFKNFVDLFRDYALENKDKFELLPNVRELLNALSSRKENVCLALVTGNLLESAFIKLNSAGIDGYFEYGIGGFGSDHRKRENLVAIGIERALAHFNVNQFEEIFVIGDSHRDIEAARKYSKNSGVTVNTVGVATGSLNVCELAIFDPDHVFENFSDIDEVLQVLG